MKRMLTLSLIVLFILLGALAVYRSSFSLVDCSNELAVEKISPNKSFIATVFERDCGATTGYATWVTIRKSSERFNPEYQKAVLVLAGKNDANNIDLKWSKEDSLLIRFTNAKVFHQDKMFGNVIINYEGN
jgi:hypothetical protein